MAPSLLRSHLVVPPGPCGSCRHRGRTERAHRAVENAPRVPRASTGRCHHQITHKNPGKTAISEFPKGRKYLISLSFRGKASVRPAQVGGFDVNIVIHGSTAVRGRGDLVAYRWALRKLAISEFPKGRKYLISLSFRGKASVRPAQVGGFDVNIVIHGSTAVRGRGDLVAYRWALWKLTAPWTHRTRPPHLGKRCAFSTSSTGPFPSNHSRKTPKGPKIALGNPDRPRKLTAPWTHRTRPPHLGKRCAFSTSSTGPFPSNHSRKTPKGPKIALGNPDRPGKTII